MPVANGYQRGVMHMPKTRPMSSSIEAESIVIPAPQGFPEWCVNGRRSRYINRTAIQEDWNSVNPMLNGSEEDHWEHIDDDGNWLMLSPGWDHQAIFQAIGMMGPAPYNTRYFYANHVYRYGNGMPHAGVDFWYDGIFGPYDSISRIKFENDAMDPWKVKRFDFHSYYDAQSRYDSKGERWQSHTPYECYPGFGWYDQTKKPPRYAEPLLYDHAVFLQSMRINVDYDPNPGKLVVHAALQKPVGNTASNNLPKARIDPPKTFDNSDKKNYTFDIYCQNVDTYCVQCGVKEPEHQLSYYRGYLSGNVKIDENQWYNAWCTANTADGMTLKSWIADMTLEYMGQEARESSIKKLINMNMESNGHVIKAFNRSWQTQCNLLKVVTEPCMDPGYFEMYWLKIPSAIKTYLLTGDKKREDYEAMSLASLRIKTEQAAVNLNQFCEKEIKGRGNPINNTAKIPQYTGRNRWKGKGGKGKGKGRGKGKGAGADTAINVLEVKCKKQWANTPQLLKKAKDNNICFVCGGDDHMSWECTQKDKCEAGNTEKIKLVRPRDTIAAIAAPSAKKQKTETNAMKKEVKSLQDSTKQSFKEMQDSIAKLSTAVAGVMPLPQLPSSGPGAGGTTIQ